jgi:hypothetical protein
MLCSETITTYCADLMDNWVIVTEKRAVLKTLSKNFQLQIKIIYNEGIWVVQGFTALYREQPIKWLLECIKRLFHTTSSQKSGPLRTCSEESFGHLYSTTIFHNGGTKVWDLTGNLPINSRTWEFRNVSFQKCRYESYRDSFRTRSAQAFS